MGSKCIRLPTKTAFTGLEPTEYIPADILESGTPNEMGKSYYLDQTGEFDAGVWACEPNRHRIDGAPYDEFVYLIEGRVDVIDDEGGVETYVAGDSFIMPRGCHCVWDVKEAVRKLYVVLTHSAYKE